MTYEVTRRGLSARRLRRGVFTFLRYVVLISFAVVCIFPFYWMVLTAFKTEPDALRMPPQLFLSYLYTENFTKLLQKTILLRSIGNSFALCIVNMSGMLLFASLAAYAFSQMQFRGSKLIFGALIATMMVPGQVTLIPLYVLFSKVGLVNTYVPLSVPKIMLNGYAVFMLRQFMLGIPKSYSESAQLDGAGHLRIWSGILLPLCKPTIMVLALFNFIGNWNDFMGPMIYLNDMNKFTVPLAINMLKDQYSTQWGTTMAASTITILPIVVLYFFSQRFFIQGIALSGIKG